MTQIRPQPRWAAQPQVRAGTPQAAAAGNLYIHISIQLVYNFKIYY